MLRSVLNEIVQRRLWPIPLAAVLIAVAAPLVFLKSGTDPVAPAPAAAGAAAPADLPGTAGGLLTSEERRDRSRNDARDPFQAPPGQEAKVDKPAADPAPGPGTPAGAGQGGSPSAGPESGSASGGAKKAPAAKPKPKAPRTTVSPIARLASVDVRFGESVSEARLQRSIPRLELFEARGDAVAIFVKYSPARDKAVFAVSPTALISGPVQCRRVNGACRYLDIPSGSHARVTMRHSDGSWLTRRIDVVDIRK